MVENPRRRLARLIAGAAALGLVATGCASAQDAASGPPAKAHTPIKHVVVLFDENISFDHYFGTYPHATNTDGTPFHAKPDTPKVNGLSPALLHNNPNTYNPKRLGPDKAATCDQSHAYDDEQKAFDGGKMDKFVQYTEASTCTGQPALFGEPGLVMDYYDGNTVTGLWNYAQNYSLNDNSFDTTFGPSSPGAINLVSGQTHGVTAVDPKTGEQVNPPDNYTVASPDKNGVGTMINDPDPAYDDCSDDNHTSDDNLAAMQGTNIGDRLNQRDVSWGWFQGGFRPTGKKNGYAVCGSTHNNIVGQQVQDYVPHHNPFSYYKSTSNPHHLPPSAPSEIGHDGQANHNYDLSDFDTALNTGNMPAVSFLKAPAYENAHAANSDPIDEQRFVATELNKIEKSKEWKSTAVVLAYDDSDGWYDHVHSKLINGSQDSSQDSTYCTARKPGMGGYDDRCGYGPRLPLLVISPYAKQNYVDHTRTDQTSIINFIEKNWGLRKIGGGSYDQKAGTLTHMLDFGHPHDNPVLINPETGAVENSSAPQQGGPGSHAGHRSGGH